jgi:ABC-type branched-subunit amino acid transport system substrate-binding protein
MTARRHRWLAPWLLAVLMLAPVHAADEEDAQEETAQEEEGEGAEASPADLRLSKAKDGAYGSTPDALVPYGRGKGVYREFFQDPPEFRGPGRDKDAPTGLEAVRIGVLAPLEGTPREAEGRALLNGVQMAFDDANADGGFRGLPFEIVAKNDLPLWGASSNTMVELAYVDRVWAVIGSVDSNSTHVAARVTLKADLPLVNVGASDPTITEHMVPWMSRLMPDDRQNSYRLVRLLFEEKGFSRVAVFRASNRHGRFGVKEFRDASRRLVRPVPVEVQMVPGVREIEPQLERLKQARVEAVVVWAGVEDAAFIVRSMRERGMDYFIAGTERLVSRRFIELAGESAEGVFAVSPMDVNRSDEAWLGFRERYSQRFGDDPEMLAAYGYDAGSVVVRAVRDVGLNRARIQDALVSYGAWDGLGGRIEMDINANNVVPPRLVKVSDGRFVDAE